MLSDKQNKFIHIIGENKAHHVLFTSKYGFKDDVERYLKRRGLLGHKCMYEVYALPKIPKSGKISLHNIKKLNITPLVSGIRGEGWNLKYGKRQD